MSDPVSPMEIARARRVGPEELARVIDGVPSRQATADWLEAHLSKAPPPLPGQRASVSAVLSSSRVVPS